MFRLDTVAVTHDRMNHGMLERFQKTNGNDS